MEPTPSTARIAMKWGAISGIVTAVFSISYQALNMMPDDPMKANMGWGLLTNFLQIGFTVLVLVLAMREFRTHNEGYISFGQGVGIAALTGAVWGVLSAGLILIYTQFIDNSAQEKTLRALRNAYEERGMTEEQTETAMRFVTLMTNPGFSFVMTILTGVIVGTVLGLIVAAVVKRDRPMFG
ncbi:hypothetical protein BWI93_14385 [Siphonobacter sp. BAB-5385]|uniref:DUF4199 domain-containing protein n=1 Tax=unclassified Siphonobacter TaxID=2635712 RepID=UPI000B9EA39B|nr:MULTISPECIES: DUF4199 domain-containing protein [unclassified Siphonobacter]OZI07520.1 hypothetical protein BWI93_14385 [Siphonobacter sp. BAB-5385]PMD98423.1 hypothetical protein BWI97_04485 [Siphonobacter sp. BAB-5405]